MRSAVAGGARGGARSRARACGRCCALGFLHGGLVYGTVLAVLHLEHNAVGSLRDVLITGIVFAGLYGLWAALFSAGGFFAASLLRRRPLAANGSAAAHTAANRAVADSATQELQRRGLFWGLLGFHLVFWELFFLYGLTYDQLPSPVAGLITRAPGMVLFLLGAALLIAAVVTLATWLYLRASTFLADRGRLRTVILVATAAAIVVLVATPLRLATPEVSAGPPSSTAPQITEPQIDVVDTGVRVALIGLDGADWRVIDPLLEAGELPAFAALQAKGVRASLETLPDANSAVIWASIYTGTTPAEHTIHDFYRIELPGFAGPGLYPVHRTYFKELADQLEKVGLARRTTVSRFSLARPPLWEIVDHAGLSLGLVDGYFYSFPALPVSHPDSFFLAYGLDTFNQSLSATGASGAIASPRDIPYFVQPEDLFRRVRGGLDGGDFAWQQHALFELLSDHPQPRLINFYTHEPDSTQHWTWKWYQPEAYLFVDDAELAARGNEIRDLHHRFDAFVARLRQTLGPDTVFVIASDHGHAPTLLHKYYTQHRHGPPGILLMAGGPLRAGVDLDTGTLATGTGGHAGMGAGMGAHVYDVMPTLLYLLGLPVPEDAAGRVLEEAIDDDFRARFPLRTVPTYNLPGLGSLLDPGGLSDERNQQELDKLKSLGYI